MTEKNPRPFDSDPITGTGQDLYHHARAIIPGGTQLLSKRPELFLPEQWPAYYKKAKGAEVWDLDGKRYLDFTHCAVGTCVLGFADDEVNAAVIKAVQAGPMSTLNSPEEVELAELLIEIHPWAEMVRYARTGGEAMAIAVRIARASTGRDKIAFCGYHGWTDWYISANISDGGNLDEHLLAGLSPLGVPTVLGGSAMPFRYNRIEELNDIVSRNGNELAAVVMEPYGSIPQEPGFLERVRSVASSRGAVLVFDEVTSGWRMNSGGIHLTLGIDPDISVFAKGISNGFAMAAIIGRRSVMDAAQDSFISSTYWTEATGPAAALATIRKHRRENVGQHLIATGRRISEGWLKIAAESGLRLLLHGMPPLTGFDFDAPDSPALKTYFTQEMLARGFMASSSVYSMLSHTEELVGRYLDAVAEVFKLVAEASREESVHDRLNGPVKHEKFQRLN